jgi:hypothetical protein
MTSTVSFVSADVISGLLPNCPGQRKAELVAVGHWALATGHTALVSAVTLVIAREGLRDA